MTNPGTQDLTDKFIEFYRDYYRDEIGDLVQHYPQEQTSLYIDARDLYRWDQNILEDWLDAPAQMQGYAEEALRLYDLPVDIELSRATVRLRDQSDTIDRCTVSDLHVDQIGEYVAVEGQLDRITGKSPRIREAVFECQRCGTTTRIPQSRSDVQEPHECQGCERQGPFEFNINRSVFVQQRKIKLAEPIEDRTQARGQSVPVYAEGDLCDYAPGDSVLPDHAGERATVFGVLRVDESQLSGQNANPETEYWIEARAIGFDGDKGADVDIEAHRESFEAHADRDDALDLVADSLAPSIHAEEGEDFYTVRRAVAAWLFNCYRPDPDGAPGYKRGDIHMALIGDPGTGKSTLMSYVHEVLPNSEFKSGTAVTQAGLTAAAVQEEFAGQSEWVLEAGVMPRADGGHALIDEIDATINEDTKAIHDALEGRQVISFSKADIHADIPTRTALMIGGNPTYTRFDPYESIADQIDLDPALIDRMDLLFTLQDEVDAESDAKTAEHVLDSWDELTQSEVAQQKPGEEFDMDAIDPPVGPDELRAWIAYARENVFPTLTETVKDRLQSFYVDVRNANGGHSGEDDAAIPATARTLEAGVRLSIAIARLNLSDTVRPWHADRAIEMSKAVVGMRLDPETGQFDADVVGRGTPKSQRDRIRSVKGIIANLSPEYDEGAPIDTVVERAVEKGLDADKTHHEIEKLKDKGEVYEPQSGYLRTT